ncbi:MAG: DUF3261 domain-containing protein, partial [Verrucomicrobia bacterium]|nr:DUF3261 domain-containing protein [Verrucomicrobiota bacterium]
MRTVCLILILLTTSACTSLRSLNAIGRHPHRVKMAVSSLATNAPATLLHTVRLDIQGRALSILGSTEIATNRLTMAALTPVGGRLFVLRYADGTITYEPSHAFTAPIRPERILLDFFMIYGQGS